MSTNRTGTFLKTAISVFILCGTVRGESRTAQENHFESMHDVAKRIQDILNIRKQNSVSLGHFTPPRQWADARAGRDIAYSLARELKRLGITIKQGGAIGIKGKYRPLFEARQFLAYKIDFTVTVRKEPLLVLSMIVSLDPSKEKNNFPANDRDGTGAGMVVFAVSGRVPANSPAVRRQESVKKLLKGKPTALHCVNQVFRVASDGKIGVQILVRGQPVDALKKADGSPRAPSTIHVHTGATYEVRILNYGKHEAAIRLFIDGLDSFVLSKSKYAFYLVPAANGETPGSLTISGWFDGSQHSDKFLVTDYPESVRALLGRKPSNEVGLISVMYSAAWPKGTRPPKDELRARLLTQGGESLPVATGRGAKVKTVYRTVQRNVGVVREVIHIRYKTKR